MNDDFLYSRQESPEPAFVAELQEKLQSMDSPEKAKRKNGQRRFNWKALAAVMSLILLGVGIFWNTPEIHIPVTNFILRDPNGSVLRDAQEWMGFEIPELPYGYYIGWIQASNLYAPEVYVAWQTYRGECAIWFSVYHDPQFGETLEQTQTYNRQLAESFSWADIVDLGNGVEGIVRATTFNGMPNPRVLTWYFEGNVYELEAMEECVSLEVLTVIAQSTLDDRP